MDEDEVCADELLELPTDDELEELACSPPPPEIIEDELDEEFEDEANDD